ncbi:hypothetical protein ACWF94_12595 [Streptomyces sp. NPDC055078]
MSARTRTARTRVRARTARTRTRMSVPVPVPARGGRRGLTAAALALAVAATATACSEEPKRYDRACGIVVDGSGSAGSAPGGFDAKAKLKAKLDPFLKDSECRTAYFAPITRVSQASPCQVSPLDLDPDLSDTADRDRTRTSLRAVALSSALKMLTCAQKQEPGSDVIGGLSRIALSKKSPKEAFDVFVVSDFEQNDPDFKMGKQDLTTVASRKTIIDGLLSSHGTPALADARVYPVGYGMRFRTNTARYQQFNAFWTEILEGRVKASVHTTYR